MGTEGNWIYCGDHFAIYPNVESLYCVHETKPILYVNYKKQVFLNTIPKTRKQAKCSLTDEQIKKMWYIQPQ